MIYNFLMLAFISQTPEAPCRFELENSEIAALKYKEAQTEIGIISSGARLKACALFPHFKNLLVTEIELGSSGTTSSENLTYLMIFRIQNKKLISILNKEILSEFTSTNVEGKKMTTIDKRVYKLGKTKDDKPVVIFDDKDSIVLDPLPDLTQ